MMCITEYVYQTKWKDHLECTWEDECNFVNGFCLSDYWKGLASKIGRVQSHNAGQRGLVEVDDEEGEQTYIVEKIKGHVEKEGSLVYLVKWKGYKEETWEQESNFEEGEDLLLAQYWKNIYNKKN
jgi:hypothetical protein